MSFASTGGTTSTSGIPSATPATATAANTATNSAINGATNSATTGNTNTAVKTAPGGGKSSSAESSSSTIKRPGTWGLFKFFYEGNPVKSPTGEYSLTYKLGGKSVTAAITPSGGDLFDKDLFRTMRAPDKFVK